MRNTMLKRSWLRNCRNVKNSMRLKRLEPKEIFAEFILIGKRGNKNTEKGTAHFQKTHNLQLNGKMWNLNHASLFKGRYSWTMIQMAALSLSKNP
jgi:hypothetical protein